MGNMSHHFLKELMCTMSNKTLIIGNIAGAGYRIKKSLDYVGLTNDFLISDNELNGAGDPSWENIQAKNGYDYITFSKFLDEPNLKAFTHRNIIKDIKKFFRLKTKCKKNNYNFGFAMGVWPILFNSLSLPYIWMCAGSDVREVLTGNSLLSIMLRRSLKRCKGIITPADDTMLKILYDFFPKEKIFVIPNYPIDTKMYTPKNIPQASFTIYHPSRHLWHSKMNSESKANDLLIKAVSRLSKEHNVKLVMAEWGIDLKHSKDLITQLGLTDFIEWHGMVKKPKMIEYYQNSDCVVDHVGWGMVSQTTLEGLACGKPTLANMSSSVERLFPDIPAFNVGSEEDCYNKLKKLIEDKEFYQKTASYSREWIDSNWSIQALGGKILDFIATLSIDSRDNK